MICRRKTDHRGGSRRAIWSRFGIDRRAFDSLRSGLIRPKSNRGVEEPVEPQPTHESDGPFGTPQGQSDDGPGPKWLVMNDAADQKNDGEDDVGAIKELVVAIP